MADVGIPFGDRDIRISVPDNAFIAEPRLVQPVPNAQMAVRDALRSPIQSPRLVDIGRGRRTATIVINDITRPTPTALMVEEALTELLQAGISDADVTLLIATGNHRPNTPDEIQSMLGGELCQRLEIVNHDGGDPAQLVLVGYTPRGVAVHVNRRVVEADLVVLTGTIAPHQTAGFSGGRKSIMPGVASHEALRTHHSPPVRALVPVMGEIEGNAFHEEAVAAARMVGVDFIINTVKNRDGDLVAVFAGDLEGAHAAGVAVCRSAWQVDLPHEFDLSIVGVGGYPKDFDLHQAQKALSAAETFTRAGGPIVLVAECRDGAGKFAAALKKAATPEEVVQRFLSEGFQADEHTSKAYMFARAVLRHPVYVVSDRLAVDEVADMFMTCSGTLENLDAFVGGALAVAGPDPRVIVAPNAADCLYRITANA